MKCLGTLVLVVVKIYFRYWMRCNTYSNENNKMNVVGCLQLKSSSSSNQFEMRFIPPRGHHFITNQRRSIEIFKYCRLELSSEDREREGLTVIVDTIGESNRLWSCVHPPPPLCKVGYRVSKHANGWRAALQVCWIKVESLPGRRCEWARVLSGGRLCAAAVLLLSD